MVASEDAGKRWTAAGVTGVAAIIPGGTRVHPRPGMGGPEAIAVHSVGRLGSGVWVKVAADGSGSCDVTVDDG